MTVEAVLRRQREAEGEEGKGGQKGEGAAGGLRLELLDWGWSVCSIAPSGCVYYVVCVMIQAKPIVA